MTWTDDYKALMRDFMARKGKAVDLSPKKYDWEEDDEADFYGWTDWNADQHIRPYDKDTEPCGWVVPEGAVLYERTYAQFTDTFHSAEQEVGINVKGCHCRCGKYTDVILRYTGSLGEVMREITGTPTRAEVTL